MRSGLRLALLKPGALQVTPPSDPPLSLFLLRCTLGCTYKFTIDAPFCSCSVQLRKKNKRVKKDGGDEES